MSESDIHDLNPEPPTAADPWTCPRCGEETTSFPALSRYDNITAICAQCGMSEAIAQFMCQKMGGDRDLVAQQVHPIHGVLPWASAPSRAT